MLDDSSSLSSFDCQDFTIDGTSLRRRKSVDGTSLLSVQSLDSGSIHNTVHDAELAEKARLREQAAANADGHLRKAPTVAAALEPLADIGKVLRPPRKKGPGYIDPQLDPFT
jgi:hypothetical protein